MIDVRKLRGLEVLAQSAFGTTGRDRNAALNALLEGARTALAVVEAVGRAPSLRTSADRATDGLPSQLVLFERVYGPRGSRLVLRVSWIGEGAQRAAAVSLEIELRTRGIWRSVGWGSVTVIGRELGVVARFFADAAKAHAKRAAEHELDSRVWS